MSAAWTVIVIAGIGTYLIRASFLLLAQPTDRVSTEIERVLRMIPPSALAAIVALQLADPDGSTGLAARFLAAIAAAVVTWKRSSLGWALVVGMVVVVAVDAISALLAG